MGIGIRGLGVFLPQEVRRNDWWPEKVVSRWQEAAEGKIAAHMTGQANKDEVEVTEGVRKVVAGIGKYASDPFRGTRERRVMAPGTTAYDMELAAAREAIQKSGVDPKDIDICLTFAICPDFLNAPSNAALHDELGLAPGCLSAEVTTVCNSFHTQMTLAEGLIRSGRAKNALLVQSSAMSRMAVMEDPGSAWFGDGASAVVLGEVGEGRGLLGWAHRNDGSLQRCLVHGVPGKRWYDEGRIEMYTEDRAASRRMLLLLADRAKETLDAALTDAKLRLEDVQFYAGHQSTRWMLETLQEHVGLAKARSVETFSWAGTLSAANIPLALSVAQREGTLRDGDVVATFTPGTGMTYSASVMRWGKQ